MRLLSVPKIPQTGTVRMEVSLNSGAVFLLIARKPQPSTSAYLSAQTNRLLFGEDKRPYPLYALPTGLSPVAPSLSVVRPRNQVFWKGFHGISSAPPIGR